MKNYKFIPNSIVFLFVILTANSQSKHGLDIESLGGYEYNYFKSPNNINQNGILLGPEDLISSSLYQDLLIDYDYQYKWKENRIRFSLTPEARLFYDNFDDSYWSAKTSVKYDYNVSDNFEFLAELSNKIMNRKGLDGDQDVLVSPLGYNTFRASTGIQFKPFKNHKTTIETVYDFTNFDKYGTRDLEYNQYGIVIRSNHKVELNRLDHKFGFYGYYKKRNYKTFNANDVVMFGTRDWSYALGKFFYEYPLSDNFDVEPSFEYLNRIDVGDNRSGYQQYGPNLKVKYDNNKTKIKTSIEYLTRNYKTIEAQDNNGTTGDLTKYSYTNFRLDAEQLLGSKIFLTAQIYSRIRTTNYTDFNARSFRNYRNQYAGLGLKMEL